MGINPTDFILLIVESNGGIVYSNTEYINIGTSKPVKKIGDLNFNPGLTDLLKSYQAFEDNKLPQKKSFDTINLSNNNKFSVIIKKVVKGDNPLYSIELLPSSLESEANINMAELLSSADENNLFLIITDGSGLIIFVTDTAKRYLQNGFKYLKGKKLFDIVCEHLQLSEKEKFKAAMFNGTGWHADIRTINENENYLRLKLIPVRDNSNHLKSFILFGVEITKLLKENFTYKRVGRLTKAIIDNIPGLFAVLREKDGKIILGEANANFIKTFKLQKHIVLNQDIKTIFASEFLGLLLGTIRKVKTKRTAYFEYTMGRKNIIYYGGKIVHLSELKESGDFYIITMRDITDILKYEKQLKKNYNQENYLNKLKASFLMNMAIEIRTPYNSIMAYSDLIEEYLNEEDYTSVKELLNSTKDVLKRVSNLFDNVTTLSQVESGDVRIKKVTLDCNEVVRLAFYKIKQEVEQKNLEFEMNLFPEELVIEADWVKIERVIFLLLDNAIRYSSKGKITLETEKENNCAHIIILDTGKGISEQELNKLLEPFNIQEDDIGISEGAGLGLTIAYSYTKLMGGKFNIESKRGKGTKITLSFPLVRE